MCKEVLRFPDGFLWGAVTYAHQVEGHTTNNDWWEWEKRSGRAADQPASGTACLHYERFEEDFLLLESLGMNAHRLSVEWSRVEPEEGIWAAEAVEHYRRVFGSLQSKHIVPFVTLNHYTIPLWLARRGGWESEGAVEAFEQYARRAVRSFGANVQLWVTINAPVLYTYRGYVAGRAPPGVKNVRRALRACRNMMKAHVRAYRAIHDEAEKMGLEVYVGLAKYFRLFDPRTKRSVLDGLTAVTLDYFFNDLVPNSLREGIMGFPLGFNTYVPDMEDCFDFIGVNYCSRDRVGFRLKGLKRVLRGLGDDIPDATSAPGFDMHPEGLYRVLEHAARFGKPLYIAENGVATDDDDMRCRFIVCHLKQVYDAIRLGGDVRGYFHYSLMDGFELRHGYRAHAGLIGIDRRDLRRRVKPSGRLYGDMCRENGLSAELVRRHCPDMCE